MDRGKNSIRRAYSAHLVVQILSKEVTFCDQNDPVRDAGIIALNASSKNLELLSFIFPGTVNNPKIRNLIIGNTEFEIYHALQVFDPENESNPHDPMLMPILMKSYEQYILADIKTIAHYNALSISIKETLDLLEISLKNCKHMIEQLNDNKKLIRLYKIGIIASIRAKNELLKITEEINTTAYSGLIGIIRKLTKYPNVQTSDIKNMLNLIDRTAFNIVKNTNHYIYGAVTQLAQNMEDEFDIEFIDTGLQPENDFEVNEIHKAEENGHKFILESNKKNLEAVSTTPPESLFNSENVMNIKKVFRNKLHNQNDTDETISFEETDDGSCFEDSSTFNETYGDTDSDTDGNDNENMDFNTEDIDFNMYFKINDDMENNNMDNDIPVNNDNVIINNPRNNETDEEDEDEEDDDDFFLDDQNQLENYHKTFGEFI